MPSGTGSNTAPALIPANNAPAFTRPNTGTIRKATETVSNLGGCRPLVRGGRPGGAHGKRDDHGRDDLSALFSPRLETVSKLDTPFEGVVPKTKDRCIFDVSAEEQALNLIKQAAE
jgi:hypothetical protein